MHKDMLKEFPIFFEPSCDFAIQNLKISHMLKHFHGHNAIKFLFDIKFSHVAGDDFYIGEFSFFGPLEIETQSPFPVRLFPLLTRLFRPREA